jgi:hypothetical protein
VAVNVPQPNMCAFRMEGIEEQVPRRGWDHRGGSQQRGATRLQPFVANPLGSRLVALPVRAKPIVRNHISRGNIGCVDFEILEFIRVIFGVNCPV